MIYVSYSSALKTRVGGKAVEGLEGYRTPRRFATIGGWLASPPGFGLRQLSGALPSNGEGGLSPSKLYSSLRNLTQLQQLSGLRRPFVNFVSFLFFFSVAGVHESDIACNCFQSAHGPCSRWTFNDAPITTGTLFLILAGTLSHVAFPTPPETLSGPHR